MKPVMALMFACVLCVYGQFGELATTDDGRQIYFSSTLKLAGAAPDRGEFRIYRTAANGAVELFAERGPLATPNGFGSSDGAHNPQVSGDGRTVGLTLEGICTSQEDCSTNVGTRSELRGLNAAILGEGSLALSRNGRWALLSPAERRPLESSPDAVLIDLETGTRTSLPPQPPLVARPVASDGTVLVRSTQGLGLWRGGGSAPLIMPPWSIVWGISDNARLLLYTSFSGTPESSPARLVVRDLMASSDRVIFVASDPQQSIRPMGMSNDGRLVLYRVTKAALEGPAFVVNTFTGQSTRLPLPDGELAVEGTLDGYGDAAVLATTAGRIVRIGLASGSVEDVVPATPFVRDPGRFPPGSMLRLEGAALPRSAEALSGRILIDGLPLPVLLANETEIRVQVPWEVTPSFNAELRLELPTASPFRQVQTVFTSGMAPRFEPLGPGERSSLGFKAVRGDFSGLLTDDPQPGEIFHVYMTGLGAVQGDVETGVPTPVGPLFPIQEQIQCRFLPYAADAVTLFAGLAPGMTGVYQVTFQMPEGPPAGRITGGTCNYAGGNIMWASVRAMP